ncbi:MAG: dehydrogenase [Cyclobacteriaceae bacterium]
MRASIFLLTILLFTACSEPKQGSDSEKAPIYSAKEELATFQVHQDLKIELVASEPMVQDPVVIKFDEDGRLWVVEMRGFMPDIEGNGEQDPVGRVSILEDSDADGQMDRSIVFLDSLVLPRALAIVSGGALLVANESLWFAADKDGDLVSDELTLIDKDYAGSSLVEHAANGLWLGVDNWYYNAKSRSRYKLVEEKWIEEETEFRGQWGICHDDEGRLYYNYNWSQLHADLVPPNYLLSNSNHVATTGIDHGVTTDRAIFPIRTNPAINRGYIPGVLDENIKLKEFTSACSPFVYRANTLPSEFYGNAFVCEPSGNLVKRNVVTEQGFVLSAYDPVLGENFLASTDERFRPVSIASALDGALYIADMYRGLVQHGAHMTPYLKKQTLKRNLDKPINLGRIWRVVPRDWKPSSSIKLSALSPEELVKHLSSDNGWVRDMAQRLLVERKSSDIVPSLKRLISHRENELGRFHALWTLEGISALEPDLLLALLDDKSILIKTTALRLLEPFAKANVDIRKKIKDKVSDGWNHPKELLQLALSSRVLDQEDSFVLQERILEQSDSIGVLRDAVLSSLFQREIGFFKELYRSPKWKDPNPDKEIFLDALVSALLKNQDTQDIEHLLSLMVGSGESSSWKQKVVLNAMFLFSMTEGFEPMLLTGAPKILNQENYLAVQQKEMIKSMFDWPGHKALPIKQTQQSLLTEKEQEQFVLGRQKYLTTCSGCHGTNGAGMKRLGPPLAKSEWVLEDEVRLALIVLHGMEGPIEVHGKVYDVPDIVPVMPAHSTLDNKSVAAILTYIRNEWGNSASAVSPRLVNKIRIASQGNVVPWTVPGLKAYMESFDEEATTTH